MSTRHNPSAISCSQLIIAILVIPTTTLISSVSPLHVNGLWSPSSHLMKVVARFGVQKFDIHHEEDTSGYIFGNVSLFKHHDESKLRRAVLALVDRKMFGEISNIYSDYEENPRANRTGLCAKIFGVIDRVAYDERCGDKNKLDLLRQVPCGKDRLCDGAMDSSKLVADYQFTFIVENDNKPEFWFLLLLACHRDVKNNLRKNMSCQWLENSDDTSVLKYDTWLVNGHPNGASNKLLDFDHQFSFEQQNVLLEMVLLLLYTILTAAQLYAFSSQKIRNLLTYLFNISLAMHCLSFFFVGLHKLVFAHDGEGYEHLATVADVIRILSVAFFILFIMIIAKGWPVTRNDVTGKPLLFIVWLLYIIIEIFLFAWIRHSVNMIREIDEYHTYPGWLSLGFRILLMLWFLYELRSTMIVEQDHRRLKFYLHFGAGIMVWFVHLPLVVAVALQIEMLWRYKLISGFSSAANFLAYAIVAHLMWPTRQSHHFLTHQADIDYTEELEYYDENTSQHESYNFNNTSLNGTHNGFVYDNQMIQTNEMSIKA